MTKEAVQQLGSAAESAKAAAGQPEGHLDRAVASGAPMGPQTHGADAQVVEGPHGRQAVLIRHLLRKIDGPARPTAYRERLTH